MINTNLREFAAYLRREEKSAGTVEKYLRDAAAFVADVEGKAVTKDDAAAFVADVEGKPVTKDDVAAWRDGLVTRGYAPTTVNSMVASVNAFLRFSGREECRVKSLRLQRRVFRDRSRELTREEYDRLLAAAGGKPRLALLMETICATGIRVSELKSITVEAAREGRAEISLKGKIRVILLPGKLCRKLLKYARKNKTASGAIFRTRSGKPISRRQIWAEMKALCEEAGVERSKVFPHNLRHLFARMFYRVTRDMAKLADVLGHSSIETTRIYLISTGEEHARVLDRLGLVS